MTNRDELLSVHLPPTPSVRRGRRAKIVATLGPASSAPEMIRKLFLAGVDVFRLNFSHGRQEDHARVHASIRQMEHEIERPVGILQDLQGPKIRVGTIKDGKILVAAGEIVRFVPDGMDGGKKNIPLPHAEIFAAVMPGQELLIDDGRVRLRVQSCCDDFIDTEVLAGGAISDRKGVNLPGTILDLSPLTAKDRADLAFGLDLGMDWVALSFVQKASDIIEARALIGNRAGLMAKIEKPQALDQIDDIIRLSDAIMVARGDLGVEIPPEEVPCRQKQLVRACRLAVKPVIIATQMLDSMVNAPTPTRAEASDVATAIYDGADAVMLSAESASGNYPVEAVEMMDRIISHTEKDKAYRSIISALEPDLEATPPHAIASAAADIANAIQASAIVAFTSSGTTALRVARKRPHVPILALTPDVNVSRRLCLLWGVHSLCWEDISSYEEMMERASAQAFLQGLASEGSNVVIAAGIPFGIAGTTNNLRVMQMPHRAR